MLKLERKYDRMKSTTASKPWQDENGLLLSKKQLEIASRKWSAAMWETYLQSLEVPQSEILVKDFEVKLEKFDKTESYLAASQEDKEEIDDVAFKRGLENLPPTEKLIVRTVYFDGVPEREAAQLLQMSRWSVRNYKQRAFDRLRSRLCPSENVLNSAFAKEIPRPSDRVTAMGTSAA